MIQSEKHMGLLKQQCVVFRQLLQRDQIKQLTQSFGFDVEDVEFKNKCVQQITNMYNLSVPNTGNNRGRVNDDKFAFQMSVLTALAETPLAETPNKNALPSLQKPKRPRSYNSGKYNQNLAKLLGIHESTLRKRMKTAAKHRYAVKHEKHTSFFINEEKERFSKGLRYGTD